MISRSPSPHRCAHLDSCSRKGIWIVRTPCLAQGQGKEDLEAEWQDLHRSADLAMTSTEFASHSRIRTCGHQAKRAASNLPPPDLTTRVLDGWRIYNYLVCQMETTWNEFLFICHGQTMLWFLSSEWLRQVSTQRAAFKKHVGKGGSDGLAQRDHTCHQNEINDSQHSSHADDCNGTSNTRYRPKT